MKKVAFILMALLLASSISAYAEKDAASMLTGGELNGNFVVEGLKADKTTVKLVTVYVQGVVDCAYETRSEDMHKLYPKRGDMDKEIITAVVKYYQKNPDKRDRSIVDVVLSGSK
ncbi:MAG: hypothetical protein HQ594_06560 [Candidatus Omnitrophica bacterium]|nr:hypothetical protein [Candidatus Omnitrophota bacterium]